ncbi:MAG: hypothetical protein O2892_18535 [Actinomycetota bacterium]|nr:hypothetical protein [Actinomycetota bacterium]MDA2951002.1 hypothetical protein [Actinomycetota bacterium]
MNLTVKTMVTACAVATAATLGLAAPAQANPSLLNGTYDIDGGDQDAYWTASSTCATDGCVARIVSNVGWSGNAVMNNGRWNLTVTKPDGVVCSDGSYAPVVIAYSVDAVSGAGTVTADSNGDCPGGQITAAQFQIKKISDF